MNDKACGHIPEIESHRPRGRRPSCTALSSFRAGGTCQMVEMARYMASPVRHGSTVGWLAGNTSIINVRNVTVLKFWTETKAAIARTYSSVPPPFLPKHTLTTTPLSEHTVLGSQQDLLAETSRTRISVIPNQPGVSPVADIRAGESQLSFNQPLTASRDILWSCAFRHASTTTQRV